MISEDMAKALFNQQSAIGKTLYLSREGDPVQIVGVYSNFMVGEDLNRRGKSYWSVLRPQVIYATKQEPQFIIRVAANDLHTMIEEMVSVFYQEQGRYVVASESMQRSQKRMYDGRFREDLGLPATSAGPSLDLVSSNLASSSAQPNQPEPNSAASASVQAKATAISQAQIEAAVASAQGVVSEAARLLGISRPALYRRIKKLEQDAD